MKPRFPVMAALLAAPLAATTLPGSAFARKAATKPAAAPQTAAPASKPATAPGAGGSCVEKAKKEDNAINLIACDLKEVSQAKSDVAGRFYDYLFAGGSKGSYVDDHLKNDAQSAQARQVLKDAVASWVQAGIDGKPDASGKAVSPDDLATLYFVIGPGDKIPDWAANQGLGQGTLKFRPDWQSRMEDALADYVTTKVAGSVVVQRTDGFLADAAAQAHVILTNQDSKDQIRISVGNNETTATNPPVVPAPVTTVGGVPPTGTDYTLDDLYGSPGAVTGKVYSPADIADGVDPQLKGHRELSVKIYSSVDDKGNMIDRIGVVDITPNDVHNPSQPHYINLTADGDSFPLTPGGRPYKMTRAADGTITIARDGDDDHKGGVLQFSVAQLQKARADQAANSGVALIGGKPYYALGQGGEMGSILFFDQAAMDAYRGNPSGASPRPIARADVETVAADGHMVTASPTPALGKIGGVDYRLKFNPASHMWEAEEGVGTTPPAPAAAAAGTTPAPGTDTTATTPAGPAVPAGGCQPGTQPGQVKNGDASLDAAVRMAQTACWSDDPSNAQLSQVKDKVHIMTAEGDTAEKKKVRFYMILFAPSFQVKDKDGHVTNQFLFDSGVIRGFGGKYLVAHLSSPKMIRYYTPEQFAKWLTLPTAPTSGIYLDDSKQMLEVRDTAIMTDILKNKLPDGALGTIEGRVKAHVPGDYQLMSQDDTINVCPRKGDSCPSGGPNWQVWPDDKEVDKPGDNKGLEELKGPGVALTAGGPFEDFPDPFPLAPGNDLHRDSKQADIAFYSGTEDATGKDGVTKTVQAWYVMIAYLSSKGADGKSDLLRTGAIPVFNAGERGTKPDHMEMQGLGKQVMPNGVALMEYFGSTPQRGAIGAYRYVSPASDCKNVQGKKGNFAGPILWWGMKPEEAVKAGACGKL